MSAPSPFVDHVQIYFTSGKGGDGIVAWRREKHVPRGGPDGGDGGRGGHIILEGDKQMWTLLDLRYRKFIKAEAGKNGEGSKRHSPEFTMIEWYRAHAGYEDIMADCIGLLCHCAVRLGITHYQYNGQKCNPFDDWEKITVANAFSKYAGIDMFHSMGATAAHLSASNANDTKGFREAALKAGVSVREDDAWEDIFHAVMAAKIEPQLGIKSPTILYDYPVSMAALSNRCADPRFAKRFELYVCGLELANAYDELTDATEQRKRFKEEMAAKHAMYGEKYPLDEDFLAALEHGMPPSGGIALGVDRLAMLASNTADIDDVLWCGRP